MAHRFLLTMCVVCVVLCSLCPFHLALINLTRSGAHHRSTREHTMFVVIIQSSFVFVFWERSPTKNITTNDVLTCREARTGRHTYVLPCMSSTYKSYVIFFFLMLKTHLPTHFIWILFALAPYRQNTKLVQLSICFYELVIVPYFHLFCFLSKKLCALICHPLLSGTGTMEIL